MTFRSGASRKWGAINSRPSTSPLLDPHPHVGQRLTARYSEDGTAWYQRGVALNELGRLRTRSTAIVARSPLILWTRARTSTWAASWCEPGRSLTRDHLNAASRAGHRRARAVIELL